MFRAVRDWVDARNRDLALRELIEHNSVADARSGFLRISRDWFYFRFRTLETGDGLKLVTSFYLVVDGEEAQAFREKCHRERYPRRARAKSTSIWAASTRASASVLGFMRRGEREVLPYRVFAIEGTLSDLDGSLRDAVKALQRELRHKPALRLREERRSPAPRREPAEHAADRFRFPGWDGVEPLQDYLARDVEEAFKDRDGGAEFQTQRTLELL